MQYSECDDGTTPTEAQCAELATSLGKVFNAGSIVGSGCMYSEFDGGAFWYSPFTTSLICGTSNGQYGEYRWECYCVGPASGVSRKRRLADEGQVSCTVDVITDYKHSGGTVLNENTQRSATDSTPCAQDCVAHQLCNHWNFEQTSPLKGTCTLFSSSDARVPATGSNAFSSGDCTPQRFPTDYDERHHLEVWVSRSIASFGTRAATIHGSNYKDGEVTVHLTEGEDSAEGRYVFLRSFESNKRLRIDGVKIFAAPEPARRLEEEAEAEAEAEAKAGAKTEAKQEPANSPGKLPRFSWPNVWRMRNLTMVTCQNETDAPELAKDARQKAAMLWAEMTEEESVVGCMSCLTHKPNNCTQWFAATHGVRFAHTAKKQKERRRMMEQLDRDAPERKRKLEEAFGNSCCRTHKLTGHKECGSQFCAKAIKDKANKRIAHTLRRMHDRKGDTTLSVQQLVATDLVAPHLHHNPLCKSGDNENAMECVSSSLIKHLGDKYGFSENDLNQKLSRYGITISDMLTSHLKQSAKSTDRKKQQYKSDPKGNEQAVAARMAERVRRSLSDKSKQRPPRVKGPRASWIKRSSPQARRLSEAGADDDDDGTDTVRFGVEPLGMSGKQVRERLKQHDHFVRNNSLAAKGILRAANLASATTGGTPATVSNLMSAAWESSLATDGSLIGRTRSVFEGIGRIGTRMSDMGSLVSKAHEEHPTDTPALKRRRKLSEFEETQYKRVDELTKRVNSGFKMPDHVDEEWGWVVDSLDWKYWWDETHRVGNVLYNRHNWVQQHAEDHGVLPVGEIPHEHRTGYSFLDINAPPTELGTWIRSKVTGNNQHTPHRKLREKRALSALARADPPDGKRKRSLLGSFLDASLNEEDPFQAAWDALHYNDHQTHTRRLLELGSWMGTNAIDFGQDIAAKSADFLFGDPSAGPPVRVGLSDLPQQAMRYASYDTLLCYMYPPEVRRGGPTGYGDTVKLHYSNRACFPFIPFIPGDMPKFNKAVGLADDFDFKTMEYNDTCDSSAVKSLIGPMMGELSTIGIIAAPYGTLLRFAEGIDSIRNFASNGNGTNIGRGRAIVCGVAQMGGLIWMAVCTLFMGAFCICAPIGSWACLRCYRTCRGASRRSSRRDSAIDELLIQSGYEVGERRLDFRVRPDGHMRVPLDEDL